MNLILHIGTPKTGTTTLQKWLYSNKNKLSEHGIFLSEVSGKVNNRRLVNFFKDDLNRPMRAAGLSSAEEKQDYFNGFELELRTEFQTAKKTHDVVILTSEFFSSELVHEDELEKLKSFLSDYFQRITVVCYLREQSDLLTSLYSTSLKAGSTKDLTEFQLDDNWANYFNLIQRWSKVFGDENLKLRVYDKSKLYQGDILYDFLSLLPIQCSLRDLNFTQELSNKSLKYIQAKTFQAINRILPVKNNGLFRPCSVNKLLKNVTKDAVGPYDRDTLNYVPQQIQEHYTASNKQLSERFFSGKDVFLDAGHNNSPRRDTLFTSTEVSNILVKVYENLAPELSRTQLSSIERDKLQDLFKSFQKSSYLSSDDTFELFRLAFKLHPSRNFQLNLEKHWKKQKQASPIKRYWLSRLRRLIRR